MEGSSRAQQRPMVYLKYSGIFRVLALAITYNSWFLSLLIMSKYGTFFSLLS